MIGDFVFSVDDDSHIPSSPAKCLGSKSIRRCEAAGIESPAARNTLSALPVVPSQPRRAASGPWS
eukprot:scaffold256_cov261-Pinguiococcus_pyrenoidosus.AAC.32